MPSVKGKLVRLLSGVLLERAVVASAEALGGFQRVLLRCDPRGWTAGSKVQVLLPSDDVRTYTPVRSAEGMVLLGWMHAGGPGARWMSTVREGDVVSFVGPQRSLELAPGPAVVVGDETSVAVAGAFAAERADDLRAVIQSDAVSGVRDAAASLGLRRLVVVPRGDTAATVAAVRAHVTAAPGATVALTGGSELVTAVRGALHGAAVGKLRTKAYWIPGRTGLD